MKRLVSFAGLSGVLIGFIGMAITLFSGRVSDIAFWHFIVAGLLVAIYSASRMPALVSMLRSRQARLGAFVSVYTLVVIAIMVAINVIGAFTNTRLGDFTEKKLFSLSSQTRKVLGSLDKDLYLRAFFQGGRSGLAENREVNSLLRSLDTFSQKVHLVVIDPEKDVPTADKYQVHQNGTLVIEYNDQTQKISIITEETIVNALIKLLDQRVKTVCFSKAHGEPAVSGQGAEGFNGMGKLKSLLERKNYNVTQVDLGSAAEVPPECTVLAIAGPTTPVSTAEMALVDNYLQLGGRVLVAQDAGADASINGLLERWGVELNNDIVLESLVEGTFSAGKEFMPTRMGVSINVNVTGYNRNHPITQDLSVNNPTQFIKVRSVVEAPNDKLRATMLLFSKEDSWGEVRVNEVLAGERAVLNPRDGDLPGSLPIAAAVSFNTQLATESLKGYSKQARLVVVGDSSWLQNILFDETRNFNPDLALNMIGWLAGLEEFLAIGSQSSGARSLYLRYEQKVVLLDTTVILMPEIFLLLGLMAWWIRR